MKRREFKFRVWDKIKRRFLLFPFDKQWLKKEYLLDFEENGVLFLGNNYIIQQFTGLKDKNGREIYEGDIVKKYWQTKQEKTNQSSLNDNGFSPFVVEWCQQHCGFKITQGKSHCYEVIGNIFQNPDLLK